MSSQNRTTTFCSIFTFLWDTLYVLGEYDKYIFQNMSSQNITIFFSQKYVYAKYKKYIFKNKSLQNKFVVVEYSKIFSLLQLKSLRVIGHKILISDWFGIITMYDAADDNEYDNDNDDNNDLWLTTMEREANRLYVCRVLRRPLPMNRSREWLTISQHNKMLVVMMTIIIKMIIDHYELIPRVVDNKSIQKGDAGDHDHHDHRIQDDHRSW